MVVRAGDRHDLADTERTKGTFVGTLELGRVVDGSNTHDHTLTRHQPRHALHRADRAGVGEGDGGALKITDGEFVALDLADQVFVRGKKAQEIHRVRFAQHRHHKRARAVALVYINCQAHVDGRVVNDARLAVGACRERVAHVRHCVGDRAYDSEPDEMGEADLALTTTAAVAVDHLAVDLEQLGGNVAEAGRSRNRQTALHVGGDCSAGPTNRFADIFGCRRRRFSAGGSRLGRGAIGRRDRGAHRRRSCDSRRDSRLVVGEELTPRLADRPRVGSELLVHLLDEPGVGAESRPRRINCSHRCLSVLVEVQF